MLKTDTAAKTVRNGVLPPTVVAEIQEALLRPGENKAESKLLPLPRKWLSPEEASFVYSIGRTRLFEILKEGSIPSVSIRKRGAKRGLRRISVEAMDAYFAALVEAQSKAHTAEEGGAP